PPPTGQRKQRHSRHRRCRNTPPAMRPQVRGQPPGRDREVRGVAVFWPYSQLNVYCPFHVEHGDFLPYALSAPLTGPYAPHSWSPNNEAPLKIWSVIGLAVVAWLKTWLRGTNLWRR